MERFWNWLQTKLGIAALFETLTDNTKELERLRKKVKKPSQRFDQIERARSERHHPNRHH